MDIDRSVSSGDGDGVTSVVAPGNISASVALLTANSQAAADVDQRHAGLSVS